MRHIVAIESDLHAGSTLAPCPPEGLQLDDGGWYQPSKLQNWLWECREEAWSEVKRLRKKGDKLHIVFNGDLTDGDHHRTPQIASNLTGVHIRCAVDCLRVPMSLKPDTVHVVRGTAAHVGRAGELEEGIARVLRAEGWPVQKDPDIETYSSYWLRLEVGGKLFDFRHHGRMSSIPRTRASYHRTFAFDQWTEYVMDGERPPDFIVRSHLHTYMDSGVMPKIPTRAIATPAWQAITEYGHRIAVQQADLGIVVVVIEDGEATVKPILFNAGRPKVQAL